MNLSQITLIAPPDDSIFIGTGERIILQWEWNNTLQENQYYFVEATFSGLDAGHSCQEDWLYFKWTKETKFVIDPWLYDVICSDPDKRIVRWTVSVGQPKDGLQRFDMIQFPTIAERRRFEWILSNDDDDSRGGGGIVIPPP